MNKIGDLVSPIQTNTTFCVNADVLLIMITVFLKGHMD